MPERQPVRAILSHDADADIRQVLRWSETEFGAGAAQRYGRLIVQALRDLEADPERAGSRARPELPAGVRTYHLASSRAHVVGERVKRPRHFVLYRIGRGSFEVLRILHDSRDLARHLPRET